MAQATRLFYSTSSDAITLHSRITPTQEQRTFLQENWHALAAFLTTNLQEKSGYTIKTWIQGSYKFGTLIKPLHLNEEYDVDLGAYFTWAETGNATPSAVQLKRWTQSALVEFHEKNEDTKSVEQPPKERCARIHYAKQFHIDVPAYHLNEDMDERILATETKRWEKSDPKAIYVWFKDKVENPDRDQLRRIIRYLKSWSVVNFLPDSGARPSSILLTVLATEAFVGLRVASLNVDDEDAFAAIVLAIGKRLAGGPAIPNPVNLDEDLNRLGENFDDFWIEYSKLIDAATRSADSADEAGAALIWCEVFSYVFPLPDTEGVEVVDAASSRALMLLPNIRIDVSDHASHRHLGTYQNELPSVLRDCDLKFTITNPEVVPAYATIEWTVRNEGQEAEDIGDLGHRKVTVRKITNSEHTAYVGRHYMDCLVKIAGSVLAVRRIAVNVRNQTLPPRNPPRRPAYTRLKSKRH